MHWDGAQLYHRAGVGTAWHSPGNVTVAEEGNASPDCQEHSASWVSSGLQGVSVPTGRRRTGGESWQGGAPGAHRHGPEGGEAWPEAQAPAGECPLSVTRTVGSSDVCLQCLGDIKAICRALLDPPFSSGTPFLFLFSPVLN